MKGLHLWGLPLWGSLPWGLAPAHSSLRPSYVGPPLGSVPSLRPSAHFAMASSLLSPFCRPEEDPFLLLQSTLSCVERILKLSVGQPLRRTWIEHPYGEEEIALLEEEVLPAIQQCLQRVDAIDQVLLEEQDAQIALEQLRQELAAAAEGAEADEALSTL